MSVTTTANPLTYNVSSVLADYELTHSDSNTPLDTSLNAHPRSASAPNPEIPCDWPTDHRRVPTYRPINTELDQSQRRVYQNPIERAFIAVMFTGVFVESVSMRCGYDMTRVSLILCKDCFKDLEKYSRSDMGCGVQDWWRVVNTYRRLIFDMQSHVSNMNSFTLVHLYLLYSLLCGSLGFFCVACVIETRPTTATSFVWYQAVPL
jgi:hypothetical protein